MRFGVQRTVRTDSSLQFTSAEFKELVHCWEATHTLLSAYFAQGNSVAERTVQRAKQRWMKSANVNEALLVYRSTPDVEGFTPAELLIGCRLNTTVPRMLVPKWDDSEFRHSSET